MIIIKLMIVKLGSANKLSNLILQSKEVATKSDVYNILRKADF